MKIQSKFPSLLCLILALGAAGIAQPPAPSAPMSLTPEEREVALKSLQATHDAFLRSIAGLSEKQWRFKPAPDRWSVAEVSEHITVSESTLLGLVETKIMTAPADPSKRAEVAGKDEIVLTRVPDRSHKAQGPRYLKTTSRWATEADVIKAFEDSRRATMDYVRTTNDDLR